jgi:menaquinone-9 beta-reductase
VADRFDVIIVGARCAGSPLAASLAERGLDVCVVDRARFPSEVPSTHLIHPGGVARLARLGLLERLLATGAPPLVRGRFLLDDVELTFDPSLAGRFEAPWLCIRRSVLDPLLIEAAEEAGAQVRTSTAVTDLVLEEGAVAGVRTPAGEIHAPLVVGADGPSSIVARLVNAREYHVTPPGRLFLWGYFEGADAPDGYGALGRIGDLGFLAMSTDAGLFMAGVALAMEERKTALADVEGAFARGRSVADDDALAWVLPGGHRPGLGASRRRRTLQGPDTRPRDRRCSAPGRSPELGRRRRAGRGRPHRSAPSVLALA